MVRESSSAVLVAGCSGVIMRVENVANKIALLKIVDCRMKADVRRGKHEYNNVNINEQNYI